MPRVHSTQQVAVKQAQLIDPSAFKFSTAQAEAFAEIGGIIGELGKRKQESQDRIAVSQANSIMKQAEIQYAQDSITTPAEERGALWSKIQGDAISRVGQLKMSGNTRPSVEQEATAWSEFNTAKTELETVKILANEALVRTADDYGEALVEGDVESIAKTEQAYLAQASQMMTPEELESAKEKIEMTAVKQMEDNARTEVREIAITSPQTTIEAIDEEIAFRAKNNEPSNFRLVSNEDLNAAKNLAKSTIVSAKNTSQIEFDKATGEATATVVQGISDGTITEADIWSMEIDVPPDKQADLGTWRKTWAAEVRGQSERLRKIQEGKDKKKREDLYNPEAAAELKNEAKKATTNEQVLDIKRRAVTALNGNIIDDADLEQINTLADGVFTTAVDTEVDEQDKRLRPIMLRGTSTEALTPWITSQTAPLIASGKTVTREDVNRLIQTFQDVARAKTWAASEVKSKVEADVRAAKEDKKPMSVNDVRVLYLQQQKHWLSKSDTELVEEYKAWLKAKP